MPPIPTFNSAPIKPTDSSTTTVAVKPEGVTPSTAIEPTKTTGPPPTTTSAAAAAAGPPPPQPGAVPIPPHAAPASSTTGTLPAAPLPGSIPQPTALASIAATSPTSTIASAQAQAAPTSMPPQFAIPPPTTTYAPSKSTIVPQNASSSQQQQQMGMAADLSHPPDYQQNPYAAEGTAAQRAALQDAAEREREEGTVWTQVAGLARTAGRRLSEVEESVWRSVGGK